MPEGEPNPVEEAVGQEQIEGAPPSPEPTGQERRSRWDRFKNRFKRKKTEESEENEPDDISEEETDERPETRERVYRNPEALVDTMAKISFEDWRQKRIEQKYKGRLGKINAFIDGAFDFKAEELTDENNKQYLSITDNKMMELARRGLKVVLNKRNALSVTAAVTIGVLTGGVGLPAAGAIFGSIAGQGVVEAWNAMAGKQGDLRREIAEIEYMRYVQLNELSLMIKGGELDPEARAQESNEFIDLYHQSSEAIFTKEKEVLSEDKVWNRRQNIGAMIGGVAGGLLQNGLSHLGEKVMTMNLDANPITHRVELVNGAWHYVYNSATEATNALSAASEAGKLLTVLPDAAGLPTHALGETTTAVIGGAAKNLARIGAVFGGLMLARLGEKYQESSRAKELGKTRAAEEQNFARQKEFARRSNQLGSSGGSAGGAEGGGPGAVQAEVQPSIPQVFIELAQKEKKSLPNAGETWIYPVPEGDAILKIIEIDWPSGFAKFHVLDAATNQVPGPDQTLKIVDLIKSGRKQS